MFKLSRIAAEGASFGGEIEGEAGIEVSESRRYEAELDYAREYTESETAESGLTETEGLEVSWRVKVPTGRLVISNKQPISKGF